MAGSRTSTRVTEVAQEKGASQSADDDWSLMMPLQHLEGGVKLAEDMF
jgi:hypothetical protein